MEEEVVSLENIKVKANAKDWKEAIEISGDLLLRNGKIRRKYIDDMIKAVVEMGPYIVLAPGFALAHAQPSTDVIENDLSLITLEEPVNFGSVNDPVNVILCMASVDNDSHIDILKKVAEKLMIEGMIGKIASCQCKAELYLLINGWV